MASGSSNRDDRAAPVAIVAPGRPLRLAGTGIMGVLNVTPDSFSDGGRFTAVDPAVEHALRMADAGAVVVDVGGESTRPGAEAVAAAMQIDRVCPVIERLRARSDVVISIDTTLAAVADAALRCGADWVNDTSGLTEDPDLASLVARMRCPVILMHRKGPPRTMQVEPGYQDAPREIAAWLMDRVATARAAGVSADRILLDPGIGFGKRLVDNLDLLARIEELLALGHPLVVGPSRKSFLGRILATGGQDRPPDGRTMGTAAVVAWLAAAGVHLLRVHDVAVMVDVLRVTAAIRDRRAAVRTGSAHDELGRAGTGLGETGP